MNMRNTTHWYRLAVTRQHTDTDWLCHETTHWYRLAVSGDNTLIQTGCVMRQHTDTDWLCHETTHWYRLAVSWDNTLIQTGCVMDQHTDTDWLSHASCTTYNKDTTHVCVYPGERNLITKMGDFSMEVQTITHILTLHILCLNLNS